MNRICNDIFSVIGEVPYMYPATSHDPRRIELLDPGGIAGASSMTLGDLYQQIIFSDLLKRGNEVLGIASHDHIMESAASRKTRIGDWESVDGQPGTLRILFFRADPVTVAASGRSKSYFYIDFLQWEYGHRRWGTGATPSTTRLQNGNYRIPIVLPGNANSCLPVEK